MKEACAMNGEATKAQGQPIAALTYLLLFVTGILLLYIEPYSKDDFVRFHARQAIVFSIAWFAIEIVLGVFIAVMPGLFAGFLRFVLDLINIALAIFWVYLMYKAYNGERYRIPQLADWADNMGFY
jgi:uncharacterized membrane protein